MGPFIHLSELREGLDINKQGRPIPDVPYSDYSEIAYFFPASAALASCLFFVSYMIGVAMKIEA